MTFVATPREKQKDHKIANIYGEDFVDYINYLKPKNTSISKEILSKTQDIRKKFQKQTLITRSSYEGIWIEPLQCMEGYGIYTFPDGSEYRGYLLRGQFNGYGTLHLAEPYNFTYKGNFVDGQLEKIDDMWFDDGLHVKASFGEDQMDFSSWKYCSKQDRRYAAEQKEGLEPVGPLSYLTARRPARKLPKSVYDVEEGLFNATNRMMFKCHPPLPNTQFIGCQRTVEWIQKYCRHEPLHLENISSAVSSEIISNNIQSDLDVEESATSCNYDLAIDRKRYFANLGQEMSKGAMKERLWENNLGCGGPFTSSSESSLSDNSITLDIEEQLIISKQYGDYILGKDLEKEASVLVTKT